MTNRIIEYITKPQVDYAQININDDDETLCGDCMCIRDYNADYNIKRCTLTDEKLLRNSNGYNKRTSKCLTDAETHEAFGIRKGLPPEAKTND